jgi:pimeloyl-ACP methyl ester carboxylesterase
MDKIHIQNRKGQNVVVVVEESAAAQGLVFVMHGLGGYKEQKQLRTIAEAFKEQSYTIVTFDTTNTFGESDGRLDDATVTNYLEDLEDVILWASQQSWYIEPFVLVGHSLGGISVTTYAERYPEKIKALSPVSSVISGQHSIDNNPERAKKWKEIGYEEKKSNSRPWLVAQIPWSHMEDRLRYNVLEKVDQLTMPVLIIVGSADDITPAHQQQVFFDTIPGRKELHVVEGAPHTFKDENHLKQLKDIFTHWIQHI